MPIANQDDLTVQPQQSLPLPYTINPASSWLAYDCWVLPVLDPGLVLHKALPQKDDDPDTLATVLLADTIFTPDGDVVPDSTGGVNIQSLSSGQDTTQRMATSTYRFVLLGSGLRVGYQIPIPGLKSVGGVTAVPEFPQQAYNRIVGNLSGIPVWMAEWELHYFLPKSPKSGSVAPVPPAMAWRVSADVTLPKAVLVPVAPTDSNTVTSASPTAKFDLINPPPPPPAPKLPFLTK